ncbi:hypothetical protein BDU57DRAFT_257516, partial [Ampelomyces quisqualis]
MRWVGRWEFWGLVSFYRFGILYWHGCKKGNGKSVVLYGDGKVSGWLKVLDWRWCIVVLLFVRDSFCTFLRCDCRSASFATINVLNSKSPHQANPNSTLRPSTLSQLGLSSHIHSSSQPSSTLLYRLSAHNSAPLIKCSSSRLTSPPEKRCTSQFAPWRIHMGKRHAHDGCFRLRGRGGLMSRSLNAMRL